jgi:hypothetical protein
MRAAVGQLPYGEPLRKRGMAEARDEPGHRQKAIQSARIARRFPAQHLEDDPLPVQVGAVDDRFTAFAEPVRDEERAAFAGVSSRRIQLTSRGPGVGVGAGADDRAPSVPPSGSNVRSAPVQMALAFVPLTSSGRAPADPG